MPTTYDAIAANRRRSALLIVLTIGLIVAFGWALDLVTNGEVGFLFIGGVVAIVSALTGYFAGDRIALAMAHARPVTREQAPYLVRIVENLAITAGVPMPKVYLMEDPTLNAFATGRDPAHASIAVTTGAIERLENEELEGVLAHELSHVKNFDIRFMTLVAVLVGMIVIVADLFWRGQWLRLGGRGSGNNRGGNGGILTLVGFVLLIFAPLAAQLIKFAASRKRELLADADGVLLTRFPEGLARALEKIEQTNTQPLVGASEATAHLFIANPLGPSGSGLRRLFSTHPPIAERVAALRGMTGER